MPSSKKSASKSPVKASTGKAAPKPVKSAAKKPSPAGKPEKSKAAPKAESNPSKKIAEKPSPKTAQKKSSPPKPLKETKTVKKPAAKPATTKPATKTAEKKVVPPTKPEEKPVSKKPLSATFLKKQKEKLLQLKDLLLDSMSGVAKDTLRSRAEGSEGNAFGMHQADAGSDAYDRDFALSLLSMEQNSLYEIDEALKRVEDGTYGYCEMSEKPIPHERLDALPFTRYTVECQAELEKANRFRARVPVTSLFGVSDDDSDGDDDDSGSGDS